MPEEGDNWSRALRTACVSDVCVWLHGCVDGRVQHGRSKVRLEKTNDEAHPTMAATSSS